MKVVVIGAGMVGSRFADELARADELGRFEIDVLGDESYEPYNRVLLTELLAGRVELAGIALPLPDLAQVTLWPDQKAISVDRIAMTVSTADRTFPYDKLVFATGAQARVIAIPGLRDGLPRGVHVLRNLNDAREIAASTLNATRAIVIGGGPLGLETACGLRHRGVDVTVLSVEATLLDRDLDAAVAAVVAAAAKDLGVEFIGEAQISAVAVVNGHTTAVQLADGTELPADLVVLACGAIPDTTLAADAGLVTHRGIVVGADLRTTLDPHVFAIGDCAETPEGVTGLVAPGWGQARALAAELAGAAPTVAPAIQGSAMRLKAVGLDVITMGIRQSQAGPGDRVVALSDASAHRHVEVVVRGETLVGVTCVGASDIGAHLSSQFDRPGILPADPLHLLMGPSGPQAAQAASPTTMPSGTTVCRCNGVTKGDLVHAWDGGASTVDALAAKTLATTGCGGCKSLVCGIADWLEASDPSHQSEAQREPTVPTR